jgi:hypothetical protein
MNNLTGVWNSGDGICRDLLRNFLELDSHHAHSYCQSDDNFKTRWTIAMRWTSSMTWMRSCSDLTIINAFFEIDELNGYIISLSIKAYRPHMSGPWIRIHKVIESGSIMDLFAIQSKTCTKKYIFPPSLSDSTKSLNPDFPQDCF